MNMVQPLPRILVPLAVLLGLIAIGFTTLVDSTARSWFERDIATRARLAVSGARNALTAYMATGDWVHLSSLLHDIAHEDHIVAAQACGRDGTTLARTRALPDHLSC